MWNLEIIKGGCKDTDVQILKKEVFLPRFSEFFVLCKPDMREISKLINVDGE